MKILFQEAQIDHIVENRRTYVLAGLGLMSLPFLLPAGWGFGLTGFMTLSLGIYASALNRWRTEPGLWMLALFLTLVIGGSWGYFEFLSLQSLIAGREAMAARKETWHDLGFAIDAVIALKVFGKVARFVASVSIANWSLTRPGAFKGTPGHA